MLLNVKPLLVLYLKLLSESESQKSSLNSVFELFITLKLYFIQHSFKQKQLCPPHIAVCSFF